ncbi:TetR/AcrR family transcriptional regulator [Paenibacillus albidus]|uniref:TetR/AcrR family transcriptional regulator n=1 Tax=Paenibacillus albidus TaxID=2041023 RepID=UPI001BEC0FDB|nr:TetR/AcrR family transcriptional regulator [Paenibacillus albidus]MBT2288829.1 TetR/AcrR family transcriptional regulator [Paenibacillus albidus]
MITTKDNMCEAAVEMFRELGYENVSINIICSQLSVTRGSFYHHFKSKNDLLLYWFSSQIKQHIVMDESLGSPRQTLKKHALDYAKIIAKVGHDLMYHILMAEFELEGKHFYTYFEAMGSSIELINQSIKRNEIHSRKSAKELMDAFIAAMIGVIVTWKFDNGTFDISEKTDSIFETIYR